MLQWKSPVSVERKNDERGDNATTRRRTRRRGGGRGGEEDEEGEEEEEEVEEEEKGRTRDEDKVRPMPPQVESLCFYPLLQSQGGISC